MNDTISISQESGQSKVTTIPVICNTGHTLSCEAVAGLIVEARHGHSGAWVNIESTPIDLTPWAGTTQDFEMRTTAGTITAHTVVDYRFRVGP